MKWIFDRKVGVALTASSSLSKNMFFDSCRKMWFFEQVAHLGAFTLGWHGYGRYGSCHPFSLMKTKRPCGIATSTNGAVQWASTQCLIIFDQQHQWLGPPATRWCRLQSSQVLTVHRPWLYERPWESRILTRTFKTKKRNWVHFPQKTSLTTWWSRAI